MNTQVYEEASEWLVKNRSGELELDEKRSFDAWLRESPHHIRAYLELTSVWEDVGSLDPRGNVTADELIARALNETNVVSLEAAAQARASISAEPRARARRMRFAMAASAVLVSLAAMWLYTQRNVYTTGIGEQRSIALNDGSTITLNSRSRIRVAYNDTEREVDLVEGQALFHVAKDLARPFIVTSGDTRVRAVGTQFDVYRKASGTVVTVVEGRVAVNESVQQARGAEVLLVAGEQVVVTAQNAVKSPKPNVTAVTAWTRRSLVFESAPLTDVAEEFNRYNKRQIVISNAELASFHVSGIFSSADPALLLAFLRTQPELLVEETDHEIRITKR